MPAFGRRSRENLDTCHADLQLIFETVVDHFDCSIICGHRTKGAQERAVMKGFSKVHWPDSKHNAIPSMAVDATPYPLDWSDVKTFCLFAGWVLCTANRLLEEGGISHRLRWGGDWDSDNATSDNRFNDLPHFELIPLSTG